MSSVRFWKRLRLKIRVVACPPDLGDTLHQWQSMSPQWESELELGSDDNNEDVVEYEMNMMRIGITKDWTLLLEEGQETTSVKCARAHNGLRFVTASLWQMCWSCVLLDPSGTIQNFMVTLHNYGCSS